MKRTAAILSVLSFLAGAGAAPAAGPASLRGSGEVRIKLDRDGRKVLYNESTVQRALPLSPALVPIPDADLG